MSKNLYQVDEDGKLSLRFHPGQTRVWESIRPFVFVLGGRQSGKTALLPWLAHREIQRTFKSGEENDALAVSATHDLFFNAFLPAMLKVFVDVLKIGHFWSARRTLEIKCLDTNDNLYGKFYQGPRGTSSGTMWGRIVLRSAQSEGSLESMRAKFVLLDEVGLPSFTEADWESVQGRTSIARSSGIGGRIFGASTPYNVSGFLYEKIYLSWLEGNQDIDVIQYPSYYNPNFSRAEYERQKASMPEWRAAMFLDGKFERPTGLIYRDFDESSMVIREEFPIPPEWERVVGVDFGGANTATLWLALNPADGRWIIYHETLMGHLSTPDHAEIAIAEATGIDNLVAVGGAKAEGQYRDDWGNAGFHIEEPSVASVESGIGRVIELLKTDRLRVFHSCTRLRRELKNYRRRLDDRNEPTEQIVSKSKWHGLDSLRYASVYITDTPGGVEILTYDDIRDSL